MRTATQIEPVALPVDFQILICRNGLDEFDLEGLARFFEMGNRLIAAPDFPHESFVLRNDLAHFLFDRRKIFGREGLGAEEIVIEAIVDHRTDGDLRARIKHLHGFGEHMGAIVADQFQSARIFTIDEIDFGIARERIGEISQHAIERHGDRSLGKRGRDGFGNIEAGRAGGELTLRAVLESDGNHVISCCSLADTGRRKRVC